VCAVLKAAGPKHDAALECCDYDVVIVIVLLCYVSVLNFEAVSYLYWQFSSPKAPPRRASGASPVRQAADSVHRMVGDAAGAAAPETRQDLAPELAAADAATEPACGPQTFTDVAVRVRRLATANSNDAALAPSVRLLADLRQRLLACVFIYVCIYKNTYIYICIYI